MGDHFQRGQVLFGLNRYREAIEAYQQELTARPHVALIHALIGASHINLRQIAAADAAVKRALELESTLAYGFYILSFVHQRRNQLAAAEKAICESLRLNLTADSFHQWAIIAEQRKKYPESLKATAEALRLDPTHSPSILLHAKLLMREGKLDEAHALYLSALANNPQNATAHHALGALQLRTGQAAVALETLREARRLDPIESNDARSIAFAYGRMIWPLSAVERFVFRWHLLSDKQRWCFFAIMTPLFFLGGRFFSLGSIANTPSPGWALVCIATANYLALPFSFDQMSTAIGFMALRQEFRLPWYKLLAGPWEIIPALLAHIAATVVGAFLSIPATAGMIGLFAASFPLVLASMRTNMGRLTVWVCLPLLFLLMIFGLLGFGMSSNNMIVGGVLCSLCFIVAYFAPNLIRWTSSVSFRRRTHPDDLA